MTKPFNMAHRGGAGLWPENTLFAFGQAARMGCDGAEMDVQLTRDGKLAVFHDFQPKSDLCRDLPGMPYRKSCPPICDLDYAALQNLDVGVGKRQERIPLLSDVIATVRSAAKHFRLFIEIKTAFADRSLSASPESVAAAVVVELRRTRFIENAVLVGFDWAALIHAKQLEPALVCWFTTQKPGARLTRTNESWAGGFAPSKFGGSFAEAIFRAGGDGWFCPSISATPKAIQETRERGLRFGVWTVNQVRDMRKFASLEVDAICTDRPDRLATLV